MVVVYYREEIRIQINQGKEVQRAELRKVPSVDVLLSVPCAARMPFFPGFHVWPQ